jgi:hypothetical protein
MLVIKQKTQEYLFALSNFIASFGGGTILGKSVKVINSSYFQDGSILAFFIGITFGLVLLQLIPKAMFHRLSRWFPIGGGTASVILLYIFINYADDGMISGISSLLFILFLSIRFGFWFFSRANRAANVAGQEQSIAWVELGYYLGMVLGLIFWNCIEVDVLLTTALILDVILQFISGLIDLQVNNMIIVDKKEYAVINSTIDVHVDSKRGQAWRLASAVVFLTIAVQVIILSLTHQFNQVFSSWIIAIFYLGAAIAAVVTKKCKIQFLWDNVKSDNAKYAMICLEKAGKKYNINVIVFSILAAFFVALSVCGYVWLQNSGINLSMSTEDFLFLYAIFCAAFFYEILALAILDRIGIEEKRSKNQGVVIRTYGMMGASAAIGLWLIGFMNNSLNGLFSILLICIILAVLMIQGAFRGRFA